MTISNPISIKVSFIIPVRCGQNATRAIESIYAANYPKDKIEIIIVEGNQPSEQRNEAARHASGDVLYFMDDDSFLDKNAISEGLILLQREDVVVVGGPAITYQEGGLLQQCFGDVVGAYWGGFITRFRHRPIGKSRPVRGEELILCNLMVKKSYFLASKGFNPDLYPGEDPELMKRLRQGQHTFYYSPRMMVYRPRRRTTWEFVRQNLQYSYGRAKHIFRHWSWRDILFFLPSLFSINLMLAFLRPAAWNVIPLLFYTLLVTGNSMLISIQRKNALSFFILVPHFFILHVSYGVGLIIGFIRFLWVRKRIPLPSTLKILSMQS